MVENIGFIRHHRKVSVSVFYFSWMSANSSFLLAVDTFMVEDAVEAIGFGPFQWKLSILTGLSWVRLAFILREF